MRLAICADEISQDFLTAVELGVEWGIRWFELRRFRSGRVPLISDDDRERILPIVEDYNVGISALSPGLLKVPADAPDLDERINDLLPRTFDLARALGTKRVVCFSFLKDDRAEHLPPGAFPSEVIEHMGRVAEAAAAAGVHLLLENEAVCWGDTGRNAAALIRQVGSDSLRLNWDPGNAYSAGSDRPFPDEYNEVKDLVAHVHVKDIAGDDPGRRRAVPVGDGEIDWPGQIRALVRDGFDGFYTIETHHRPLVQASRRCVDAFRRMVVDVV